MNNKKPPLVILILLITIAVTFGLPRNKYKAPDIVSTLNIPVIIDGWRGSDIAQQLNLKDERYNFIGEVFARVYENKYREKLLLLILNAGNFHHPKVCFGSSGFKAKELPDLELQLKNHNNIRAKALYVERSGEGYLLVYWICINKDIVDWTEQKLKQLWYSLFNKEKVGLMVRLDIPASENNIDSSLRLAKEFVGELIQALPQEQKEYLFGK